VTPEDPRIEAKNRNGELGRELQAPLKVGLRSLATNRVFSAFNYA